MWFKRARLRQPEKRNEPIVRFVREQDGEAECELKTALIPTLEQFRLVRKAYLARVDFGDSHAYNVALCISGPEDGGVVSAVSDVFGDIFSSSQHLDIMFLTAEQEADLGNVCRPFYTAI